MLQCDVEKIIFIIFEVTLCFYMFVDSAHAACNVCQDNQVACINSTSFYLCFGENTPYTDVLYHCKDGFECTEFNAICLQASATRPPSCGSTSLCGQCTAQRNALFACMSRNTFQMCYGGLRPTGQLGYCPNGFVCDATSDSICVSAAGPNTVTCDVVDTSNLSTINPTTASSAVSGTTTDSTTSAFPLTADEVCAQKTVVGLYPTMPHDPFCKRYIHCRHMDGVMSGIEYTCATNTYYSMEDEVCTMYKPAYCI